MTMAIFSFAPVVIACALKPSAAIAGMPAQETPLPLGIGVDRTGPMSRGRLAGFVILYRLQIGDQGMGVVGRELELRHDRAAAADPLHQRLFEVGDREIAR